MQKFNDGHLNTNGKVNEPDLVKNGGPQIQSALDKGPSFKPGQPFTFSTGRDMNAAA